MIRGAHQRFRVYPYWCSEQIASAAEPLLALYRAGAELGADSAVVAAGPTRISSAWSRRWRAGSGPTAGIGLWSAADWTTPWLSAYAGAVLLEAKRGRARGGRLGARPPRRLSAALARGARADHWRRCRTGTTAATCG